MKSKKVLLGLFAGFLALMGGAATAQTDTNFIELGPVNVGGQVSSLVVDQNDASSTTVFAGAITGGLYVRSENSQILQTLYPTNATLAARTDIWHYVPYTTPDSVETVLPVSCMVQTGDGDIMIGTGSDEYQVGSSSKPMSVNGMGVFCFNSNTFKFELVSATRPAVNADFEAVRAIDYIKRGDVTYVFVVTKGGLYRLQKSASQAWRDVQAVKVFDNANVDELAIARSLKVGYFTVGGDLYKIGDVTASTINAINITGANTPFYGSDALRIAVAPSDPTCVYVMAIASNGMMSALYRTHNLQTWTLLNTSTVNAFSRSRVNGVMYVNGDGHRCGVVAVDPGDADQVYIGGSSIWTGRNYVEGSYFQWIKASYCEQELNYGNYMGSVFSSAAFVHSGIHQIVPAYPGGRKLFYVATDGGVYRTSNLFATFENINRGLNNVQVNSVAVSPDGTVISGAHNNSCPIIESRSTHHGGTADVTWYDDGTHGNLNHDANVLWTGNGSMVAASMFQQVAPSQRRTVFVSSGDAQYGRAYSDYFDYTQTQTWTSNKSFSSNQIYHGLPISYMHLWETTGDTHFNDSTEYHIDTLGVVYRPTSDGYETKTIGSSNFQIKANDEIVFLNKSFANYPIRHKFEADQLAGQRVKVKNKLQSRMLLIGTDTSAFAMWRVWLSWRATDFTKVWDRNLPSTDSWNSQQLWAGIYFVDTSSKDPNDTLKLYSKPRAAIMSADGRMAFIAVTNPVLKKSMIVRVKDFENVDFSATTRTTFGQIKSPYDYSTTTRLSTDTLFLTSDSSEMWLPRVISSMVYDTMDGAQRIVLTFEDYSDSYANVAVINNAMSDNWAVEQMPISGAADQPAYCSMVERSTGKIYVGTNDGIWIKDGSSWQRYAHLAGVPVTSIVQQKAELPTQSYTGHNGINEEYYVFAKTKWPGAIYIGTYGRGIFLDMTYVTDRENEITNPEDFGVGVPTVAGNGNASVSIYPNPVSGDAHLDITAAEAGRATLRIYDLSGRMVQSGDLGLVGEGVHSFSVSTNGMAKGMYLVNVTIGGHTAAAKMMVR